MIDLRFIGTGALGSVRCRNKLSKEYRRFPSLLVDEKLIIDPSEDIFEFEESFMLSGLTKGICDVLITHSHLGHFSVCAIERLAAISPGLTVHAGATVCAELSGIPGIRAEVIYPFGIFSVQGYEIIPLPSNHITDDARECAFNFLFKKEKTFFYGLDGGFINPSAWRVIKEAKPELFIMDCALGDRAISEGCIYHNNFEGVMKIRELLIACGAASEYTRFILSHIPSERRRELHEDLTAAAADYPSVRIAYDGYFAAL